MMITWLLLSVVLAHTSMLTYTILYTLLVEYPGLTDSNIDTICQLLNAGQYYVVFKFNRYKHILYMFLFFVPQKYKYEYYIIDNEINNTNGVNYVRQRTVYTAGTVVENINKSLYYIIDKNLINGYSDTDLLTPKINNNILRIRYVTFDS